MRSSESPADSVPPVQQGGETSDRLQEELEASMKLVDPLISYGPQSPNLSTLRKWNATILGPDKVAMK